MHHRRRKLGVRSALALLASGALALVALGVSAALSGCAEPPAARQCMSTSGSSSLVSGAALLRIDVYPAGTACEGSSAAAPTSARAWTMSFAKGAPIKLDLPPGEHTVVLIAFADAGGTEIIGGACTQADFQPGQSVCLDLTLTSNAMPDLSAVITDSGTDDAWTGCRTNADCTASPDGGADGGALATPFCNPTSHMCVGCLSATDCAVGQLCGPAGFCVQGCDPAQGKGCASGLTCCDQMCVNVASDTANCGACGRACGTAGVATAKCSAGLCASSCTSGHANCVKPAAPAADDGCETSTSDDPDNCGACGRACSAANVATRTCSAGLCTSTCTTGFGNCLTPAAPASDDGCETNLTSNASHCGSCANSCGAAPHATLACVMSKCAATCTSGYSDCDTMSTNGCECATDPVAPACCAGGCQTQHSNGYGGSYYDCGALGMPGVTPTTYTSVMANEAAASLTSQTGTASGGWSFGKSPNTQSAVCKTLDGTGNTGTCTCWVYDATGNLTTTIGHTYRSSGASGDAGCWSVLASDPTWN